VAKLVCRNLYGFKKISLNKTTRKSSPPGRRGSSGGYGENDKDLKEKGMHISINFLRASAMLKHVIDIG